MSFTALEGPMSEPLTNLLRDMYCPAQGQRRRVDRQKQADKQTDGQTDKQADIKAGRKRQM